ncbi:MAG: C39 family peptidase [Anaerolineales bacterium]|nr:C39 family peptidase [Anaerolineales bacterium]
MPRLLQFSIIALLILLLLAGVLWIVSSDAFGWRFDALRAQLKYALNPPERVVFVPSGQQTEQPSPTARPSRTPTPTIALATVAPTHTPTPLPTATQSPTPLPPQAMLSGIVHQYQMWNNCGPANLAMALSYWGWKGDQRDAAAFLKPNARDKNVMPYEMEAFVEEQAGLDAVVRVGGNLQTLKAFISSGLPVIVEKGFEGVGFDGWMGHYQVVNGYDDAKSVFYVQDSYKGPDLPISYEDMMSNWRAFNFTYIVIYPDERRQQVLDILGLNAYDNFNYRTAEQIATQDISRLSGRDLYFALFNQGASRVALQDYAGAAASFDAAFANYERIPTEQRPWRMMWYQTGPYFAYYFTGRYEDVINLATQTLDAMSEPILEESYYWRARALLALGDNEAAIKDLNQCLEVHEGFAPCLSELAKLGIFP